MSEVRLTGLLVCANEDEAAVVAEFLPEHIALTRREPGCRSFEVTQADDPLMWRVEERFADEASFLRHQERVAASEWGAKTVGIERRYAVDGIASRQFVPFPTIGGEELRTFESATRVSRVDAPPRP